MLRIETLFLYAFVNGVLSSTNQVSYKGAQVWRTRLKNSKDFAVINGLHENHDILIWQARRLRVDYMVSHVHIPAVQHELENNRLSYSVLIDDVEAKRKEVSVHSAVWTEEDLTIGHRLNFKKYATIKVIHEFIQFLKDSFPSVCTVTNIATSVENRPVQLIRVSNGDPLNKPIVVVAGSHGREWASVSSALYILNNIVTKFDKQPRYITSKDWYFIPLLNPDGYSYSTNHDRLWSKNRRQLYVNGSGCMGVDLNRNYDKFWQSSKDTCSNSYPGQKPFSEPELVAVKNLLESMRNRQDAAFVDIHAYGQTIGYPSSVSSKSAEHKALDYITAGMAEAAFNVTRHKYETGSMKSLFRHSKLYGVSIDWAYSMGVMRSILIQARDTGYQGYFLQEDQIEAAGIELLAAIRFLAKDMKPARYRSSWF